jgi:hypothetical protein
MSPTGFANTGGELDPATGGFPEPASTPAYDLPMLSMLGMVSDVLANYNYDKQGNVLNKGAPVTRNYGLNWYEFYGQDAWRIKPNLTITYGGRWSLFPPPWEVNGLQASPTCDSDPAINPGGCPSWAFNLGTEFNQMAKNMKQGIGYGSVPLVSYILGGAANHGPGWYNFEKSDFSPRISIAYSPRPQAGWMRKLFGENDNTVFRGGFSKVYDRAGMQMLSTFDANPPGGLGATLQNPCCAFFAPAGLGTPNTEYDSPGGVPRVTNINVVPTVSQFTGDQFLTPAPPGAFPQTPGAFSQAITWGVDQSLKTPHAYAFDFSIGRELPKKLSLQLAYVGRLGRNLLTQRDLRQPLDLFDPKTGIDYFAAATALSKVGRQGLTSSQVTNQMVGKTAQYWQDLLPAAAGYQDFFSGFSTDCNTNPSCLIQVIYDAYYNPLAVSYPGNEVVGLGNVDIFGALGDNLGNPVNFPGGPGQMLNNQATSMFGWSSIGSSNYNALQATLRKQFGSAVQFDLNYTYSKSIDITSSATRLSWSSSVNVGAPGTRLVNAFDPNGRRGVSDFDLTHQINANWIIELPFGNGRHFSGNSSHLTDAFIGGWQLSGLTRWTSGFPFTVDNGNFWPTNWDEQGIANMVTRPQLGHHRDAQGAISVFANPTTAFNNDFAHPFPGQSGSRNVIRGDGYAGLDMALAKRWKLPNESQSLQFRWEVFNVPNLHRFNVESGLGTSACTCIASLQQLPQSFGDYTGLLTQPREMQFALRFEF